MSAETGRRFGPYEIQSRLGGGGMGFVYRAWDARLHREVAIKLLNHEYSMPGMRERFLREARAASALNHPNICTIFDIGEQDGDPYLVMELLQGETLKDRIADRAMPVDEIVSVSRETAEALAAAHSKGVIHRDVKPANIFLVEKANGGRQAKVLDFGLAKIEGGVLGARQNRSTDLTTVGATVGTLAYMSPEQARGEVLDTRSDLFSLGVVMYEMATRHVPFRGATSALVFVQLLNHPPEPVREWNESVPRELEKIIFKLLAKDRTARYQTALELEQALAAVTGKGGGGWLRKAVSAVPLVRAADPVARGKLRLPPRSGTETPQPSYQVQEETVRTSTPVPPRNDSPRPADDQFLRPVSRLPRGDTTPSPARFTSAPEQGVASTFSVATPASGRRAGDPRPASSPHTPAPAAEPVRSEVVNALPIAALPPAATLQAEAKLEAGPQPAIVDALPDRQHTPADELRSDAAAESSDFPERLEDESESKVRMRFGLPVRPLWLGIGGFALLAGGMTYYQLAGHGLSSALLSTNDVMIVTEIENQTGDKTLDMAVAEGLRIALAESPWLKQRDGLAYRTAQRLVLPSAISSAEKNPLVLARQSAEKTGARVFLYGSITGSSAPYTLRIDLRETATSEVMASTEARADSLQQVPGAIDQVAAALRTIAGEPHASIDKATVPLTSEGSGNLVALAHYANALSLLADRQLVGAVGELEQSIALDPHFPQAHLRLTEVYQRLRAESAASTSARLALSAADQSTQHLRTFAQATYEVETSGDYLRATSLLRQLTVAYPHDAAALALLARTQLLTGHLSEALQSAQQAYAEDPYNAAAYLQAEDASIALDRAGAAIQIDGQAQRQGLGRSGQSLTAAYLDGRQEVVNEISSSIPVGRIEYRPDWHYGIYLDNTGHLAAGAAVWRSRADAAAQNDALKSAAVYLLAQGAYDRALLGDCGGALSMVRSTGVDLPEGRQTLFHLGMADALCGGAARANQIVDALKQQYPQSFEVNGYFLANIRAAIALEQRSPDTVLPFLEAARPFDLISVTPYLRGLAHVRRGEVEVGIVDLQTILSHHGSSLVTGSGVYPAAQIAVARAFATSGDLRNSATAYRRFLELWRTADVNSPLVTEAHAHAEE